MTRFNTTKEVDYFRLISLKVGLKLLKVGIKPDRSWTLTKALKWASDYTGKKYRRSEVDAAIADLSKKQEEMLK